MFEPDDVIVLNVPCRERHANAKNLRQKERKLKDVTIQMEDERKQAQLYKDQVTQQNITGLKR